MGLLLKAAPYIELQSCSGSNYVLTFDCLAKTWDNLVVSKKQSDHII